MNGYTPKQQEYINSVDGNAHMSAVEIIGELEERHTALVEAVEATRRLERKLESECDDETEWKTAYCQLHHARAEVDRLLGEK